MINVSNTWSLHPEHSVNQPNMKTMYMIDQWKQSRVVPTKYQYQPRGGLLEISRRRTVSKAKILKGKCEPKLAFLKGWGGGEHKAKKNLWGGMDVFWNNTMHRKKGMRNYKCKVFPHYVIGRIFKSIYQPLICSCSYNNLTYEALWSCYTSYCSFYA